MLEDLKRRPRLMGSFVQSLMSDRYIHVVSNGKGRIDLFGHNLTKAQVEKCKQNFYDADFSLAGTSHGRIIKPLFVLSYDDSGQRVFVHEYLTFSDQGRDALELATLENDLTKLAIIFSILYPDIRKIYFPYLIDEFSNEECYLSNSGDGFVLFIK